MLNLDEAWDNYLCTRELSLTSFHRDKSRYAVHLQQYWHGKDIESIKTPDIISFKQHLLRKGLNGQTVKLCLSQLRRIIRRAKIVGIYSGDVPYFEMPKVDSVRYRYLEKHEAKLLLTELKNISDLWHDISLLSLNTGMRAGEIFGLKGENINSHQKSIILYNSKSGKQRIIPLNEAALSILQSHKSLNSRLIFHQQDSPQVPFYSVSKLFRLAVKSCGLNNGVSDNRNKVVFHTLRHTFASWLVQDGTPIYVVSKLLGHGSKRVTERYAHLAPEQGRTAVDSIPSIVSY